jgi:hypothetical protein
LNDIRFYKRTSLIKNKYLEKKEMILEMVNFLRRNGGFKKGTVKVNKK